MDSDCRGGRTAMQSDTASQNIIFENNEYNIKKLLPYLVILIGLFLVFFIGQPIAAGVCFLVGVVMIKESLWPEEWEADKQKKQK